MTSTKPSRECQETETEEYHTNPCSSSSIIDNSNVICRNRKWISLSQLQKVSIFNNNRSNKIHFTFCSLKYWNKPLYWFIKLNRISWVFICFYHIIDNLRVRFKIAEKIFLWSFKKFIKNFHRFKYISIYLYQYVCVCTFIYIYGIEFSIYLCYYTRKKNKLNLKPLFHCQEFM